MVLLALSMLDDDEEPDTIQELKAWRNRLGRTISKYEARGINMWNARDVLSRVIEKIKGFDRA